MENKWGFLSLLIFLGISGSAQVAVRYEPRHKVALENEYIRLLDVRIQPGDTSLFHIHETPSFFIPLSSTATGSQVIGQAPAESRFTSGSTWFNGFTDGPLVHRVWNSDKNILHVIDLELLSTTNSPLPATIVSPSAKISFENEKLRVYQLELLPKQNILLPLLQTPMLFISVAGPTVDINEAGTENISYQVHSEDFRWLGPQKKFQVTNKEAGEVKVILILLK